MDIFQKALIIEDCFYFSNDYNGIAVHASLSNLSADIQLLEAEKSAVIKL